MVPKVVFFSTLTILILNVLSSLSQNITIRIPNGLIKGTTEITKANYTYYSFSGVRYAQPPVGNLRFKSPLPIGPWNGTYDATYEKYICLQANDMTSTQNEDCLFLNIDTPNIYNASLPVMFFIHGGGFCKGTEGRKLLRPDFFMEYNVVFVSINYRLGAFGFSSTNDMIIPGNAGLKDQNVALQWVYENIQYFGGDPKKVMIFGQSAGSASVSYHILSHKSTGLFRAAIMESGSALSAWAYQRDQRYYTFKIASSIDSNFKSNSSEELHSFLLNASAEDIHNAALKIFNMKKPGDREIQQGFYFAPVIEPDHNDAFLTKSMFEKFARGDFNRVPTIMGINAEEGIGYALNDFDQVRVALNKNGSLLVPRNMHIDDTSPNKDIVTTAIRKMYNISNETADVEETAGIVKYFTDHSFARSIIKQAELQSNYSDVYFYVFSYRGIMGNSNTSVPGTANITHGEELPYIFARLLKTGNNNTDLDLLPKSDVTTHYRLMKLWVTFATTLNPTPEPDSLLQNLTWPKVNFSTNALQYLDINTNLTVKSNPRWEAITFWNDLYNKYAVPPLDGF